MRTRSLAGPLVASALLVAGCGGGLADGPAVGGPDGAVAPAYAEIAALPAEQQRDRALELARQEGSLSVYTSMTADVVEPLTRAFQDRFGIPVEVFRANSETVVQRTLQEAQSGRPGGDVVESDFAEMMALSGENVFADYDGAARDRVRTGRFDGWTAARLNLFLPAWNTDLVAPGEEPRSWEDLADPRFRGKITMELSDSDWFANLSDYWLAEGRSQQEVDGLWQGIAANANTTRGHVVMMELLGAGQTAMDAMNYTYITQRAADNGAPVAYRLADGTNPMPAFPRPNGVGMLGGAAHPGAAWLFTDWYLSEGQQVLVDHGLTPSTDVPGDSSLDGLNIVDFDTDAVVRQSAGWDQRYDGLLRGVAQVAN